MSLTIHFEMHAITRPDKLAMTPFAPEHFASARFSQKSHLTNTFDMPRDRICPIDLPFGMPKGSASIHQKALTVEQSSKSQNAQQKLNNSTFDNT
jgi:hypothetical protein